MEIEFEESFDFGKEYDGRHDIVCRGFYRVLEDLYNEGILTMKCINTKINKGEVNGRPDRIEYTFQFGK